MNQGIKWEVMASSVPGNLSLVMHNFGVALHNKCHKKMPSRTLTQTYLENFAFQKLLKEKNLTICAYCTKVLQGTHNHLIIH